VTISTQRINSAKRRFVISGMISELTGSTISILDENHRGDKPPTASEAASGETRKPRAPIGRESSKYRPLAFYAPLSQLPASTDGAPGPLRRNTSIFESWTTARITTIGEWVGSAAWLTTPALPIGDTFSKPGESPADDPYLAEILIAIADDVARHLGAVCAGISSDFASRMSHAQKHLPRSQAAAAVQALKQALQAALQLARETARMALKVRQENARIQYRREWRRRNWRDPSKGSPRR
jgi:hypothetical protein